MTDGELLASPSESVPQTSKGRGIVEWFWRGAALARTRHALPEPGARATLLAARARQNIDFARDLLAPVEPADASAEATACELYRQASYWLSCALSPSSAEQVEYRDATWDTLDEQLLERSVEGAGRVEALRAALRSGSFVFFAELPAAEQYALRVELQKLTALLLDRFDTRTHALQGIYVQRGWRLGLVALVLLSVPLVVRWRHDGSDLALGKPWTASSKRDSTGCTSPAQECKESPGFFFHTNEEHNPWVEFDLGAPSDVSALQVDNRLDCCTDRAMPLTVDVSTNHRSWKTVARYDEDFVTWRPSFKEVKARWVRLRVHKDTYMHLSRVRIYP